MGEAGQVARHSSPVALSAVHEGAGAQAVALDDNRQRPRLSAIRTLTAVGLVAAAAYVGVTRGPAAVQAAYATKSPTWFAPYVDATLTPAYSFQDRSLDPARQVVLGFVVSGGRDGCTPSWGAAYDLQQADQALALGTRVAELRQQGVGAMISFGGEANTDLAVGCTNVDDLERAYGSVVTKYATQTVDFDVEGAALSDFPASERRATAVAALQAAMRSDGRQLQVWLTLPVEPSGLQADAISVIDTMLRARVSLAGVNVMTMDFASAPGPGQTMLDLARKAATAAHRQLQRDLAHYGIGLSSGQVWRRLGVTVMVGQNDYAGQVFTTADAQGLVGFADNVGLGRLSMWSLNRDSECGQAFGESGVLSDTCSGTSQVSLAFSHIFSAVGGVDNVPRGHDGLVPPVPDTNPANALYPLWSPTADYQAGYKVVRDGYVYEAKWYDAGQDPAQVWPYSWETPWELIGPVLPTDHAPKMPTLPAGTYPAWSPGSYYQAGARILYQGLPYQAKWYNQGQPPAEEASDPYGSPWQPLFTVSGEPSPD